MEKYGQDTPPEYALGDIDFPVAIMGGELDLLSNQSDLDWSQAQLKKTTNIFYQQYYLGHMSFAIAKDMSFFTVDAMAILNHHNDKCSEETINSKFEVGNQKCRELAKIKEAQQIDATQFLQ